MMYAVRHPGSVNRLDVSSHALRSSNVNRKSTVGVNRFNVFSHALKSLNIIRNTSRKWYILKQRPDVIPVVPSTLREMLCRNRFVETVPSYYRKITSINRNIFEGSKYFLLVLNQFFHSLVFAWYRFFCYAQ